MEIKQITKIAKECGLTGIFHRPEELRLRFSKGPDTFVDVWYSTMTVGTVLTHPTSGRGQLFRRHVDEAMLRKIFMNPRQHTGRGYKKKRR